MSCRVARYRAANRAKWFADKVCIKCGSTTQLQLDHKDRTTKVHHAIWTWNEKRRNTELAKCQVLCYPCHKIKTRTDMGWGNAEHPIHGREAQYRQGCRCYQCKMAHASYRRIARQRNHLGWRGKVRRYLRRIKESKVL